MFYCVFDFFFFNTNIKLRFFCYVKISDIGGQADMKHIFGTIVAEEKGKVGKEDKVKIFVFLFFLF